MRRTENGKEEGKKSKEEGMQNGEEEEKKDKEEDVLKEQRGGRIER